MKLSEPLLTARKENRLGLIVYTVPGFPNRLDSRQTIEWLQSEEWVSVIETTIPVITGFSDHANSTIRNAHTLASEHATDIEIYERLKKPSLCVLYESTAKGMGFESVCQRVSGIFDGMILEWSEPNEKPYVEIANRQHIELGQ